MTKAYNEDKTYKRIFEIDLLRGICIALVMLDHLMYHFAVCYSPVVFFQNMRAFGVYYWYHPIRVYTRYVVIATFFLISGISSSFSKNNLVRGLRILAFAMGLTLVTTIASKITGNAGLTIDFGVIHVFACAILIYALVNKLNNFWLIAISAVAFFLAWYIPTLEIVTTSKLLLPFGVRPIGYEFGDHFSLFPWIGFFIIGGMIGKRFYRERKSLLGDCTPKLSKSILAMGRYSIFYYFGEQVILIPLFYFFGTLI